MIHPYYTLKGWIKLYGWPDWKEAICIIIHDWGYWGCSDMDGKDGEKHPFWAGGFAYKWLDENYKYMNYRNLCFFHSSTVAEGLRFYPSRLCWADKYGMVLMPTWMWVLLGRLSGEITEYMNHKKYPTDPDGITDPYEWHRYQSKIILGRIAKHA